MSPSHHFKERVNSKGEEEGKRGHDMEPHKALYLVGK